MAALEENIFTMERGTRAEGKPVGFRRFSRRDARVSRKPEARRIPTPVIRPINCRHDFYHCFQTVESTGDEVVVDVLFHQKTEADDVEKEEWDHQIRKKKQDTHTKLRERIVLVNICGKRTGKYREKNRK
mgnify:CR=1 FL=1